MLGKIILEGHDDLPFKDPNKENLIERVSIKVNISTTTKFFLSNNLKANFIYIKTKHFKNNLLNFIINHYLLVLFVIQSLLLFKAFFFIDFAYLI